MFETVADALARGGTPPAALDHLWDGLEACWPTEKRSSPRRWLRPAPRTRVYLLTASGLVDHTDIGNRWEATQGRTSITDDLLEQLQGPP